MEFTEWVALNVELPLYLFKITLYCFVIKCMISLAYGRHMYNPCSSLFLISPTLSISLHVFQRPLVLTFSTTWLWVALAPLPVKLREVKAPNTLWTIEETGWMWGHVYPCKSVSSSHVRTKMRQTCFWAVKQMNTPLKNCRSPLCDFPHNHRFPVSVAAAKLYY